MALGGQVVDLVGPHLLDDADEAGGVREVAVVQDAIKGDSIENSQENRAGQVSMFIILSAAAASGLPGG